MYIQQNFTFLQNVAVPCTQSFRFGNLLRGWVGIKDIIVSFVRRTGPDMRRVEAASFDIIQVANYNLLVYHCAVPTREFR
jgi:hypothetical protein